jgi:hypothetical protein
MSSGHSFCQPCIAQNFSMRRECPLCNELCFISDTRVNISLQAISTRLYPNRIKRRQQMINRLREEQEILIKRTFELADIPVLYTKHIVTPGNIEYIKIIERRYKDMLQ